MIVVDARRFDEYAVMSIPTATSVPGAELALRVRELAPDPATTVVVNCAGRTRSIIVVQSLINAGLPNPVVALRNGTIGWTLAGLELEHGQARGVPGVSAETSRQAEVAAWGVAQQAGVRRVGGDEVRSFDNGTRTVYRFDVRTPQEYESGHRSAPGWAAADLADALADAGVPWLGGAELVVLAGGTESWARSGRPLESGQGKMLSPTVDVYRRPYEGTSVDPVVMQAYLDWEHGLVAQLGRDGTHGVTVLTL